MVTPRWTLRSTLWALRLTRLLIALMIPLVAILLFMRLPAPPDLTVPATLEAPTAVATRTRHDLSWYAPIWERDLQQSPIPAAPVQTVVPEVPREPLPTLVATMVTEEGSWAQLRGADGRLRLKTVEDVVGAYRIAAIEPGRVQVMDGTHHHWLEIPRHPGK